MEKTETKKTRGPLDPPAAGERMEDRGGHWIGCCGIWWSRDAWTPPSAAIEMDAARAAEIYRVIQADRSGTSEAENCPSCGKSFHRNDPNRVDARRVLDESASSLEEIEKAYRARLTDVERGEWVRFGPQVVQPGESARIFVQHVGEQVEVRYLALPSDVAARLRVLSVHVGREDLVDGPLPGELFAARVPTDARRPIDRGGSLRRRATIFAYAGAASVTLENRSNEPVEVLGALFGPTMEPICSTPQNSTGFPFDPTKGMS